MNEVSISNLINFIVVTLPNLFINLVNAIFTPLSFFIGNDATNFINWVLDIFNFGFMEDFIVDTFLSPILNVGLIGLFSVNCLIVIIALKIVDLVIPL